MTEHEKECLDRFEAELRPGMPPIDRNIELPSGPLAVRLRDMRDLFLFSNWSRDKIYAAAIIDLAVWGYDPEEERAIAKRISEAGDAVSAGPAPMERGSDDLGR